MVEAQEHVLRVLSQEGWRIEFRGETFGPYPDLQSAASTAAEWAENAGKQGMTVRVVVDGDDHTGVQSPR